MNIIDSDKMAEVRDKLYELLPKIRKNAVALVDAFDWQDSNLSKCNFPNCSVVTCSDTV